MTVTKTTHMGFLSVGSPIQGLFTVYPHIPKPYYYDYIKRIYVNLIGDKINQGNNDSVDSHFKIAISSALHLSKVPVTLILRLYGYSGKAIIIGGCLYHLFCPACGLIAILCPR
jgi:hypothetical protein